MKRRLLIALFVGFATACARKSNLPPPPPPSGSDSFLSDKSYQDLAPGSHLRITLPLLKDNAAGLVIASAQANGSHIALSTKNLLGFQISYYLAEGDQSGQVQLKFISADITKKGHTHQQSLAPPLPFPLPQTAQFVRLVFLVRVSESDHNMAIVAAGSHSALDSLTTKLSQNPAACQTIDNLFCAWVPQGIAVRPE